MIPISWNALAVGGVALAVAFSIGWIKGAEGPKRELAEVRAVASAADDRYRKLEQEVADAQAGYVEAYKRSRDAARSDWVRIKSESAGRVPAVCPQSGGVAGDQGAKMATAGPRTVGDILPAVIDALETGEQLEATLALCQTELRQCSGLR